MNQQNPQNEDEMKILISQYNHLMSQKEILEKERAKNEKKAFEILEEALKKLE